MSDDTAGNVRHLPLRREPWNPGVSTGDAASYASKVARMLRAHGIAHDTIWIVRGAALLTGEIEVKLLVELRRGKNRFEWTVAAGLSESELMESVEILFGELPA